MAERNTLRELWMNVSGNLLAAPVIGVCGMIFSAFAAAYDGRARAVALWVVAQLNRPLPVWAALAIGVSIVLAVKGWARLRASGNAAPDIRPIDERAMVKILNTGSVGVTPDDLRATLGLWTGDFELLLHRLEAAGFIEFGKRLITKIYLTREGRAYLNARPQIFGR